MATSCTNGQERNIQKYNLLANLLAVLHVTHTLVDTRVRKLIPETTGVHGGWKYTWKQNDVHIHELC